MFDILFPSDPESDVPILDLALQAEGLEVPIVPFGFDRHGRPMLGCWHFYTDDKRFVRIWERPDFLRKSHCAQAIEVAFVVTDSSPLPFVLWSVYRKRWLARFWQSSGIKIWADMSVPTRWQDLNLIGIPDGWRSFAIRGTNDNIPDLIEAYNLALTKHPDPLFLIYGGGAPVREYAQSIRALHVESSRTAIKRKYENFRQKYGPR